MLILWEIRADVAEELLVPLDIEAGVQAALEKNLVAAEVDGVADFIKEFLTRNKIRVVITGMTRKGAKTTITGANVCVVDVAVDVVRAILLGCKRRVTSFAAWASGASSAWFKRCKASSGLIRSPAAARSMRFVVDKGKLGSV